MAYQNYYASQVTCTKNNPAECLDTSCPVHNQCIPLSMARCGQCVKLSDIRAGQRLRHRLTELGLSPGVEFSIVQDFGGPLLLAVRDSRLAIGRGEAHKIMVQPL